MDFNAVLNAAVEKAPVIGLAHDLLAVAHKHRYPMAAILAKVPGDTLSERARQIGVSRQTMYVWAQERFRPSNAQAAIIASLTGVPVEQIADYQEGKHGNGDGTRKTARKKVARVAKAGRKLSGGAARLRAKRTGVGLKPGKRRYDRPARVRTPRRPRSGKSD